MKKIEAGLPINNKGWDEYLKRVIKPERKKKLPVVTADRKKRMGTINVGKNKCVSRWS